MPQPISLWDISNDELNEPIASSTFIDKEESQQF